MTVGVVVRVGVIVTVGVIVRVGVIVGVRVIVRVGVSVRVFVTVGVTVMVRVTVVEGPIVLVGVTVMVRVGVMVGVDVVVRVGVRVAVVEAVEVTVDVGVQTAPLSSENVLVDVLHGTVAVAVDVEVRVGVDVRVTVDVRVDVTAANVLVAVAVRVGVTVSGTGVRVMVGDTVMVRVTLWVTLGVKTGVAAPTVSGVWTASINPTIVTATRMTRTSIALPFMRHQHRIPGLAPPRTRWRHAGRHTFDPRVGVIVAPRNSNRQCSRTKVHRRRSFARNRGSPGRAESQGRHQRQDILAAQAYANR